VDKNGAVIANLSGDEKRKIITLEDMAPYLPKAYVAIEDERFLTHNGVDIKRTAAAIFSYIIGGGDSNFGGSTITQQLVKNLSEDKERDWTRKIREWYRAYELEKKLNKEEIFTLYVNTIYFGDGCYGIKNASEYYFSKNRGFFCAYLKII
jgi:penicillin-binding protein 1A